MTILETTEAAVREDEPTALEAAFAAGLDAVARLHADALDHISHLAETWGVVEGVVEAEPEGDVRVLRMAELPTVVQRVDTAA